MDSPRLRVREMHGSELSGKSVPDLGETRLEARLRAIRRFRRLCWLRNVDREGVEVVSAYLRVFLPYPYTGCVLVLLKFCPK